MAEILLSTLADALGGPVVADATFTATATRARAVGDGVVANKTITVSLTAGVPSEPILLDQSGVDWCWRLRVVFPSIGVRIDRTVAVPDVPSVEWADLVDVDPATLLPDAGAVPAWTAAVGQVAGLLADTVVARDAATTAQGLSEDARDAAVLARGIAEGARDGAVVAKGASEAARDQAQVYAANTVELQDTTFTALLADPESGTRAQLSATIAEAVNPLASSALMRAPHPPYAANVRSMLGAFAPGHIWAAFGTGDHNLNDTSDHYLGTQSATVAIPAASTALGFQATGLGLNLTGKMLRFYLKLDNAAVVSGVRLYVGNAGLTASWNKWITGTEASPGAVVRSGEWAVIDVTLEDATVTGTPDIANVDTIRVFAQGLGATPTVFKFGGVAVVDADELNRWPNGVLAMSFDDNFASHFTKVAPYLDKYGYRATMFPILSRFDQPGFMTTDQALNLRDRGWEIGAHATTQTVHDNALTTLSPHQRHAEFEALRIWMSNHAAISTSYAYPVGYWSKEIATQLAAYFDSGRLATGRLNNVRLEAPYRVQTLNVGVTGLATTKALIDAAVASRTFLSIYWHNIVDSGASGGAMTVANFQEIVDYVRASGIAVATYGEVVASSAA